MLSEETFSMFIFKELFALDDRNFLIFSSDNLNEPSLEWSGKAMTDPKRPPPHLPLDRPTSKAHQLWTTLVNSDKSTL